MIDSEVVPFQDVSSLTRGFRGLSVVCIYRPADESTWAEALAILVGECSPKL